MPCGSADTGLRNDAGPRFSAIMRGPVSGQGTGRQARGAGRPDRQPSKQGQTMAARARMPGGKGIQPRQARNGACCVDDHSGGSGRSYRDSIKTFISGFVIPTGPAETLEIRDQVLGQQASCIIPAESCRRTSCLRQAAGSWNAPASGSGNSRVWWRRPTRYAPKALRLVGGPVRHAELEQTDYCHAGWPGARRPRGSCNGHGQITVNGVPWTSSPTYIRETGRQSSFGNSGRFQPSPCQREVRGGSGDHRGIRMTRAGHEADPGKRMIPESE